MEKNQEQGPTHCLNCGTSLKGAFCDHCGQRGRDNTDRSLSQLLGEFLSNIFFIDNRFLQSVWYLFRFPGRMTVEFLEGKRKKFISPITLFLFFNLIFFFISTLSDYSLSLTDQYYQVYSPWTKDWINFKMQSEGLDWQTYSITYQTMSDNISKSLMIINVPITAAVVFLIAFKKRKYYFDSLIFTFHFFSFFMASWVMLEWVKTLLNFLSIQEDSIISQVAFTLFTFILPLLYAMFSIKKFLKTRWYWAIPAGVGVMMGWLLASLFYRFIIFSITISIT